MVWALAGKSIWTGKAKSLVGRERRGWIRSLTNGVAAVTFVGMFALPAARLKEAMLGFRDAFLWLGVRWAWESTSRVIME